MGRLPLWLLSGGASCPIARRCSVIWRWDQIVVLVVLYGVGVDLFAYATGFRGGHLLPAVADPNYSQAYGLLSWQHGLVLLNEQLLVASTVVLVLFGVRCVRRAVMSNRFLQWPDCFPYCLMRWPIPKSVHFAIGAYWLSRRCR